LSLRDIGSIQNHFVDNSGDYMENYSYCQILGISDFQILDGESSQIIICENPQLLFYNKVGLRRTFLFSKTETYSNVKYDPILSYRMKDIYESIKDLLPNFREFKKEDFDLILFPDTKNKGFWEKTEWNKILEPIIINQIIAFLLNDGWKIMEKNGFWFEKKEN
jgi:hypothetical protein